ncbi:MAG: FxsA family protein [Bacteriovoracaceae bacterium]|jgi:UPF0716 protein FxsA|nr:FxsA family protein [Bacteriovoracaceae bacterium]
MFFVLLLLFTVVPALEIYLLITASSAIGGGYTIGIVLLTGLVGAALAKSEGLSILGKIQSEMSKGQLPANQFIHGLLVFGGGLLLLTPGFLTDILGLSMVIPGSRHLLVSLLKGYFKKGIETGNIHFASNINFQSFQSNFDSQSAGPSSHTESQIGTKVFEAEYSESSSSSDDDDET